MVTRICPKCKKQYTEQSERSDLLIPEDGPECNNCWAASLQDAVNKMAENPDKYIPPSDKPIVSIFKRAYNILVTEKKAQYSTVEHVLDILKNVRNVDDLIEASNLLEANGIEPKDVDIASQFYDFDPGTSGAYIQKAIGDIERIIKERKVSSSLIKTAFSYSSTQINLPEDIAKKIIEWGNANIPEDEIFSGDDGDYDLGREKRPHVTIKYGLHTVDSKEVEEIVKGNGEVLISLGNISIFEPEGKEYDVVKIEVQSDDLRSLNAKVSTLKNSDSHPEYKPHVTIAYVKKGNGQKYVGRQDFKGISFSSDVLDFSAKTEDGKDNNHTMLKL